MSSGTLSPNGTGHGSTAALFIAHGPASTEPSVTSTYTYNGDDQEPRDNGVWDRRSHRA